MKKLTIKANMCEVIIQTNNIVIHLEYVTLFYWFSRLRKYK